MRITLWGDRARDFDDSTVKTLKSPIMIAFAGFRVTEYRGSNTLRCLKTQPFYVCYCFLVYFLILVYHFNTNFFNH